MSTGYYDEIIGLGCMKWVVLMRDMYVLHGVCMQVMTGMK